MTTGKAKEKKREWILNQPPLGIHDCFGRVGGLDTAPLGTNGGKRSIGHV